MQIVAVVVAIAVLGILTIAGRAKASSPKAAGQTRNR
jgi:hypothetical protein